MLAARTGVTVILPKGKSDKSYPAAWFSLNGDGELTGIPSIEDFGMGAGAIGITTPTASESCAMQLASGISNTLPQAKSWIFRFSCQSLEKRGMAC